MFTTPSAQVGLIVMLGVCAVAFRRGGRVERWLAAANAVAWLAINLIANFAHGEAQALAILGLDGAFEGVLLWAVLSTDRAWTFFAAAFQLVGLSTDLAEVVNPSLGSTSIGSAAYVWAYLILLALLLGVLFEYPMILAERSGVERRSGTGGP